MFEIAGERIYYVDFHCQWGYKDCPAIFLAGLSYCGFDAGLMVIPETYAAIKRAVKDSGSNFIPFRGKEHLFNWGHILTMGFEGTVPSDADFRKTLFKMKQESKLVIFAHPLHPPTRPVLWDSGQTSGLLEEGLIDAIELVNSYNYNRDKEIIAWYAKQNSHGRLIPVTGGCDVHYLQTEERPVAVYSPDFPPYGPKVTSNDIDALGSLRTLVLAEECTEAAMIDAARNCRTVIETQGRLFGPKALVEKLLDAGYWEASENELQKRRDLSLVADKKKFIAGQEINTVKIKTNLSKGCFTIAGTKNLFHGNKVDFQTPRIGAMDEQWVPVTASNLQGQSLTSALRVIQPIGLDIFGCRSIDDPKAQAHITVTNQKDKIISGNILAAGRRSDRQGAPSFQGLAPGANYSCRLPLNFTGRYDVPSKTGLTVRLTDGEERTVERKMTFIGCHYTEDGNPDWSRAEAIKIGRKEQVAVGNWDGLEDASARIKLLWSNAGLCIRADVRDNIHCQPFHGDYLYQGDSIQIGIDSMLGRGKTQFSKHEFMTGLTDSGAELFYTADGKPKTLLPDSCVTIQKETKGLIYELCIPWQWLVPLGPGKGNMFGLFILLWDNDGPEYEVATGSKSVLTWPEKIFYGWKAGTRHWAVITLLD